VKDEMVVYNFTNGMTLKIHKEVFQLIKDCKSKLDIIKIADALSDKDKEFFMTLAETIENNKIFTDCSENAIKEISYIVTHQCNLRCKHCCMVAKTYNKNKSEKIILDFSIIKTIVSYNPETIILTGGEPLIVDNMIEMLIWLKENYNNKVILSTNAILINEKNVEILCDTVDIFDISLDGLTSEKSDKIRGVGTYNKVMQSINLLQNAGAKRIRLSNALTEAAKEDGILFNKMYEKMGIEPIIRYMTPTGRAKDNDLFFCDQLTKFLSTGHFSPNICGGGITKLSVDSDGDVYPCNNFIEEKYRIGNILDTKMQNILLNFEREEWFKNFSCYLPNYRNECKECEVNQYCWTCPFEIKLLEDSNNIKDLTQICKEKKEKMLKAAYYE
jgi:radical SAM protein with 4Fe4S-binding SPASM domain